MEENIISALIARVGALIPLMDILRGKRSAKNVKIKINHGPLFVYNSFTFDRYLISKVKKCSK